MPAGRHIEELTERDVSQIETGLKERTGSLPSAVPLEAPEREAVRVRLHGNAAKWCGPGFETILKATASFAVQLVLSTGDRISAEELSAHAGSAIIVNRAPQLELLERATLVITHACLNSSLEALT